MVTRRYIFAKKASRQVITRRRRGSLILLDNDGIIQKAKPTIHPLDHDTPQRYAVYLQKQGKIRLHALGPRKDDSGSMLGSKKGDPKALVAFEPLPGLDPCDARTRLSGPRRCPVRPCTL